MNPAVLMRERIERNLAGKSARNIRRALGNPSAVRNSTILIATNDPEIHDGLASLLGSFPVNSVWVGSVEDVKTLIARERITACLCGFWLRDGTYREVIRHISRERPDIPTIIVSAPGCPHEYREFIAAMNIRALDFLCHPYRKSILEGMLETAIAAQAADSDETPAAPGISRRASDPPNSPHSRDSA